MSISDAISFAGDEHHSIMNALHAVAKKIRNFDKKDEITSELIMLYVDDQIESPYIGKVDLKILEKAATEYFGVKIEISTNEVYKNTLQNIDDLEQQIKRVMAVNKSPTEFKGVILTQNTVNNFNEYDRVRGKCKNKIEFLKLQLFRCCLVTPEESDLLAQLLTLEPALVGLYDRVYHEHPLCFALRYANTEASVVFIAKGIKFSNISE